MEDKTLCEARCEHKSKLRFSTYFQCDKYNVVLLGNPCKKCKKCLEESQSVQKTRSKKANEYIKLK